MDLFVASIIISLRLYIFTNDSNPFVKTFQEDL